MPRALVKLLRPVTRDGLECILEAFTPVTAETGPPGEHADRWLVAIYGISEALAGWLRDTCSGSSVEVSVSRSGLPPGGPGFKALLGGSRERLRGLAVQLAAGTAPEEIELGRSIEEVIRTALPDSWKLGAGRALALGGVPKLMGVLNLTPDSFYAGSRIADKESALVRAGQLLEEGADIIDLGGESTRPGAAPVSVDEEIGRIVPVIAELVRKLPGVLVSVDTYKAEVARAAVEAGARIVNDIGAGLLDPEMLPTVAGLDAGYVMMHMRGKPATMQADTAYEDLLAEIYLFFREGLERARSCGVETERIVLDPGIGFGKPQAGNYEIMARLMEFASLGRPLLAGPSRKSFLTLAGLEKPEERLEGTLAACTVCTLSGASILRVHDIAQVKRTVAAASRFKFHPEQALR